MAGILVIAEHRDGAIKGITKEALTLANQIAPQLGGDVTAVVLGGSGTEPLASELTSWAAQVLVVEDAGLEQYTPEGYVAALKSILQSKAPQLVLTGHSYQAIEFFPRLAAAVDAALVPDCVQVVVEDGRPVFTRKVINGKLDARCHVEGDGPWLASLQQGAFPAADPGVSGAVEKAVADISGVTRRQVVSIDAAEAGEVDLTAADVIVAGGRGVGGKDEFKIVFDLADALGAAVGSSRPPCDSEWVEHERQIGSSGQVVAPKLYFAVGISGAIQHLVGMRGSQVIVAINKDGNAPIFQEATYGIVGDLHEVLPPLIEAVKEAQGG